MSKMIKYPYSVTCPQCGKERGQRCTGKERFHKSRVLKARQMIWGSKQPTGTEKNGTVVTRQMTSDELERMS